MNTCLIGVSRREASDRSRAKGHDRNGEATGQQQTTHTSQPVRSVSQGELRGTFKEIIRVQHCRWRDTPSENVHTSNHQHQFVSHPILLIRHGAHTDRRALKPH